MMAEAMTEVSYAIKAIQNCKCNQIQSADTPVVHGLLKLYRVAILHDFCVRLLLFYLFCRFFNQNTIDILGTNKIDCLTNKP